MARHATLYLLPGPGADGAWHQGVGNRARRAGGSVGASLKESDILGSQLRDNSTPAAQGQAGEVHEASRTHRGTGTTTRHTTIDAAVAAPRHLEGGTSPDEQVHEKQGDQGWSDTEYGATRRAQAPGERISKGAQRAAATAAAKERAAGTPCDDSNGVVC